MEENG
jgi:hypothetical protein